MNIDFSWAQQAIDSILQLLPKDPFQPYIHSIANSRAVGWLNWFIPVGAIESIVTAWLLAIALYYVYMLIMRWAKLI